MLVDSILEISSILPKTGGEAITRAAVYRRLPAVYVAYYTQILRPIMAALPTARNDREARTLCEIMDAGLQGDVMRMLMLSLGRLKALQSSMERDGGGWQVAQNFEMIPPPNASLLSERDRQNVARDYRDQMTSLQMVRGRLPPGQADSHCVSQEDAAGTEALGRGSNKGRGRKGNRSQRTRGNRAGHRSRGKGGDPAAPSAESAGSGAVVPREPVSETVPRVDSRAAPVTLVPRLRVTPSGDGQRRVSVPSPLPAREAAANQRGSPRRPDSPHPGARRRSAGAPGTGAGETPRGGRDLSASRSPRRDLRIPADVARQCQTQ